MTSVKVGVSMNRRGWLVRPVAILAAAVLAGCTSPGPSRSFGDAEAIASLECAMQAFMDQDAVGVLAQVGWPGSEWSKAYGVSDLDTLRPAQPKD